MEKFDQYAKELVIKDVTITGYMMFLNEKGLLNEANDYVKGFIHCLTKDELNGLFLKTREVLKK